LTSKTTFWWLYNTNRLPAAADATFWWLYNTNRLLAGTAITDPLVVRNIERFILGFEAEIPTSRLDIALYIGENSTR